VSDPLEPLRLTEEEAREGLDEMLEDLRARHEATRNPLFVYEAILWSAARAWPALLSDGVASDDVAAAMEELRLPAWVNRHLWTQALALVMLAWRLPDAKRATPASVAERLAYLTNFVDPGRNAFADYAREREEARLLRDFERLRDELGTAAAAYGALLRRARNADERSLRRAPARARRRRGAAHPSRFCPGRTPAALLSVTKAIFGDY